MPQVLQHRRFTTAELSTLVGSPGEFYVDTDKNIIVVMDGVTPGGHPMPKAADIPTSTLDLTNDTGYINETDIQFYIDKNVFDGDFTKLSNIPTTIDGYGITDAFDGQFSSLANTPGTLDGYGITDAYTKDETDSAISAAIQTKDNTDEIAEGNTNLYYTDDRARASLEAAGDLSYDPINGVISFTQDHSFSSLTGTPTTIAGYGITDAFDGQYSSLTGVPTNISTFTNDSAYIKLVDLSVGPSAAASGPGSIAYNSNTGAFTFTPPDLSTFITALADDPAPQIAGDLVVNAFDIKTTAGDLNLSAVGDINLVTSSAIENNLFEFKGDGTFYTAKNSVNNVSYISTPRNDDNASLALEGALDVTITSNTAQGGPVNSWVFSRNGELEFPDGTVQLTATPSTVSSFTNDSGYWVANNDQITNWDTAYSWGDHNIVGYALQTDLTSGVANSSNWDTAYSWGDHGAVGYALQTSLNNAVANSGNWDTAYSWGDHNAAGYITATLADSTFVDVQGDVMTGFLTLHADPTQALHATTKQYVDNVATGVKTAPSCRVLSDTNLVATYDNGVDGVGATLTATANGALGTIDGISNWELYDGILAIGQTNSAENGRYFISQIGDSANPWILTRCAYCDESNEIPGSYIFITDGNTYEGTGWIGIVDDPTTFNVGNNSILYTQFSGAGTYTAGAGLVLNATQFAHGDTSNAANLVASGRTYVTGLAFDDYGHVTSYTTGSETVVNTDTTYSIALTDGATGEVDIDLTAGGSGSGTNTVTLKQGTNVALTRNGNVVTIDSTYGDANVSSYLTSEGYWVANNTQITNWDTAYSWGDHAAQGYVTTAQLGDSTSNAGNWDTAYSWGDHALAGYWVANNTQITNWDTAYSWGDHSTANYANNTQLLDYLPIANWEASEAYNITSTQTQNWDEAYSWGDHSTFGYADSGDIANAPDWDTAVSWGDHAQAGYWVANNTQITNWDTAYSWGDHSTVGYLSTTGYTKTGNVSNGEWYTIATADITAEDSAAEIDIYQSSIQPAHVTLAAGTNGGYGYLAVLTSNGYGVVNALRLVSPDNNTMLVQVQANGSLTTPTFKIHNKGGTTSWTAVDWTADATSYTSAQIKSEVDVLSHSTSSVYTSELYVGSLKTQHRVWHEGNFTSTNVSNWNAAYSAISNISNYSNNDVDAYLSGEGYSRVYNNGIAVANKHTLDNPNPYGTSVIDNFGKSVAISGNYAVVGARYEDEVGGLGSGKAYIYDSISGTLIHTLSNPNAYGTKDGDYFGGAVAISGNNVIISAYVEGDAGGNSSGKVYVFNVANGSLLHTIDNPNAYSTSAYDYFGWTVSMSGNNAIIGAWGEDDAGGTTSGKAYIFEVTTGNLLYTLDNPTPYGTSANDNFGYSVAMSGNYAIVGAYKEDDAGGSDSGKAYIYNVTTGALVHTLNNPNAYNISASDYFGANVGISQSYAIVGAYQEDDAGGITSGKAYIFDVATGNLLHTLDNPNPYGTSGNDRFSQGVAISEKYAVVGAWAEDAISNDGTAYIFDVTTGALLQTIDHPNTYGAGGGAYFGNSISLDNDQLIIGAYEADDENGNQSGKAYIFNIGLDYTHNFLNEVSVYGPLEAKKGINATGSMTLTSHLYDAFTVDSNRNDKVVLQGSDSPIVSFANTTGSFVGDVGHSKVRQDTFLRSKDYSTPSNIHILSVGSNGPRYSTNNGTTWAQLVTLDDLGGPSVDLVADGDITGGDPVVLNTGGTTSSVGLVDVPSGVSSTFTIGSASSIFNEIVGTYHPSSGLTALVAKWGDVYFVSNDGYTSTLINPSTSIGSSKKYETNHYVPIFSDLVVDPVSGNLVYAYAKSTGGVAIIVYSTTDGTSITSGTELLVETGRTDVYNVKLVVHTTLNKICLVIGNGANVTTSLLTISGLSVTSSSFRDIVGTATANAQISAVYCSVPDKLAVIYENSTGLGFSSIEFDASGPVLGSEVNGSFLVNGAGFTGGRIGQAVYVPSADRILVSYRYGGIVLKSVLLGASSWTVDASTYTITSSEYYDGLTVSDAFYEKNIGQLVMTITTGYSMTIRKIAYDTTAKTYTGPSTSILGNINNNYRGIIKYTGETGYYTYAYNTNTNTFLGRIVFVGGTAYNLTESNYLGISKDNYSDGQTATILLSGSISPLQSGLTIGASHFVNANGDITTTNNGIKVGKAISSTKLLLDTTMNGPEMNTYLVSLLP